MDGRSREWKGCGVSRMACRLVRWILAGAGMRPGALAGAILLEAVRCGPLALAVEGQPTIAPRPLQILGASIDVHTRTSLELEVGESFAGRRVTAPVKVVRGDVSGPTICLIAGIHGDEVVGIEIVRRLVDAIDPDELRGAVIAMPIANPMGFRSRSRYLPDRRDLNRFFPGRSNGSAAARAAHRIFDGVIRHCQIVVDFHTGSFLRSNLPQVRADLDQPLLMGLATWFRVPVVTHSVGQIGTLRRAATDAGIQAVLYEAGEPMTFDERAIADGVAGTLSMLRTLGMLDPQSQAPIEFEILRGRHWIRAEEGGIFRSARELGERVRGGERLGTITNPFTNETTEVRAKTSGRIIGRAHDQVVIPGFALYHIGTTGDGYDRGLDPADPDDRPDPDLEERPE